MKAYIETDAALLRSTNLLATKEETCLLSTARWTSDSNAMFRQPGTSSDTCDSTKRILPGVEASNFGLNHVIKLRRLSGVVSGQWCRLAMATMDIAIIGGEPELSRRCRG